MSKKTNHDLALGRIALLSAVVELLNKVVTLLGAVINYPPDEKKVVF